MFVLTPVKPNTLITAQAVAICQKHGQVAETFVADRTRLPVAPCGAPNRHRGRAQRQGGP